MFLACQDDSYTKELSTKVVSCELAIECGIHKPVSAFNIILEDTVIFPGGGGQPKDKGFINGIPIDDIEKRDGEVYHRMKTAMAIGSSALVSVFWPTRFDHMQQHTGQHLLTALAETMLNYSTTSWNMGPDVSYIELDTPEFSIYNMELLEQNVNSVIRECKPITVEYYEKENPALLVISKRLELPEGHSGLVRVIRISGIDANTCCGTHVKNTSELQVIKLLYAEKVKRNKTNVFFVVGERVLKYLRMSVNREKHLTRLLGCSPEEQPALVEVNQNNLKVANKELQATLRDVGVLEAKLFKMKKPVPSYYSLHRSNGSLDFLFAFLGEVDIDKTVFILTIGLPKTGGHMIVSGPLLLVERLGPRACDLLDGKGCIISGRFQAKIKLANVPKIDEFLRNAAEQIAKYFAKP